MNNKKVKLIVSLIIVFAILIGAYIYLKHQYGDHIPNDYIAIFNGGTGEITYSTYIYKINNGQENYGFKYINTINTTVSWGEQEQKIKVTDKGKINWTDDAFAIAKKNNAYSYVKLPNDNKIYTIEEFKLMFSLD